MGLGVQSTSLEFDFLDLFKRDIQVRELRFGIISLARIDAALAVGTIGAVVALFLIITRYQLLYAGWRGLWHVQLPQHLRELDGCVGG